MRKIISYLNLDFELLGHSTKALTPTNAAPATTPNN